MKQLTNDAAYYIAFLYLFLLGIISRNNVVDAMTVKQLQGALDMMKSVCAPKYKVPAEILDGLRNGGFIEGNQDLKCYTMCIAQMAGTMTKKGEISTSKTLQQIEAMLPDDMKEAAKRVVNACKDVQKGYKDPCDRAYYSTKCAYETDPAIFLFP